MKIPVEDASQIAEARRVARGRAANFGFAGPQLDHIALVVTEAATNLLKHAGLGEILIRNVREDDSGGMPALEILVLDRGPGMDDIDRCMRDGFSTAGSPGQGLGAITRLSGESDFYSVASKGTAILARWLLTPDADVLPLRLRPFQVGAVNVCKPGQEVCGDSWGIEQSAGRAIFLMADGLGHGIDAQTASLEAVRTLRANPAETPKRLLELVHLALRSTRGAAVAVGRIDRDQGTLHFAGVGNISAQIYNGVKASQHLVSLNGTAGHQIPRLQEFHYAWPEGALLVLHSDGLSTGTGLDNYPRLAARDPSLTAGILYRDFSRSNDDSTVVVIKAAA
ncbi:MAG: SpoIIE family protein phosphatase [Bryobacteraceae bacterium]